MNNMEMIQYASRLRKVTQKWNTKMRKEFLRKREELKRSSDLMGENMNHGIKLAQS